MIEKQISNKVSKTLSYKTIGEGLAVILIHGFPLDGKMWQEISPNLAKNVRLIIPDLPGVGGSSLNCEPSELTMDLLAECIYDICVAESIQKVVLVGHSMGGYIALAFTAQFPKMLAGLSLVHSTAFADAPEKIDLRKKSIQIISKGGKKIFLQQMFPTLFDESFKANNAERLEQLIAQSLNVKEESLVAFYHAIMNREDRTSILKAAKFPVQWIIGKGDHLVPSMIALQQSRFSMVTFVSLFSDCGHMSMLEQPEKLSIELKDFFNYCLKY